MSTLRFLTSSANRDHRGGGGSRRRWPWSALAVATALVFAAAPALAQDPDDPVTAEDGWHFTIAPYLWATGLEGTVSFEGTPDIPVDASFSDILDNLDLALAGHFEGRRGRWGFGLDAMYVKIGAGATIDFPLGPGDGPSAELQIDLQETMLEGFGFYRLALSERSTNPGFFDLLAGFRYVDVSQEVVLGSIERPRRDLDWTDLVLGLRGYAPLGDRFGLMARGDVSFVGSDYTFHLKADLHWRISNRWRLIGGYKYMDFNLEKGEGLLDREVYNMQHSGPEFAVSFSW
jgi:hypothetical protein